MIEELIGALGALDPEPTVTELADALWLADQLRRFQTGATEPPPGPPAAAPSAPGGGPDLPDASPADTGEGGAGRSAADAAVAQAGPPVGLFLPASGSSSADLARAPTVPALFPTLPLARALRPLRRTVLSRTETEVHEEETAQRIAETRIWAPVLRPMRERWFDLALVVDDGASMVVWRRTVVELQALLEHVGAFRDIRVWSLATDGDRLLLRAGSDGHDAPGRSPHELTDPTQRRVVLVVSDCIGRAWETGAAAELLERWGRVGPVAIVQPLPQRLWHRCAAAFEPVRLRAAEPGIPNDRLRIQLRDRGAEGDPGMAVPVLELEERWLRPWASMVGSGGKELTGVALLTGRPVTAGLRQADDEALSPLDRVRRFRATASPTAFQLAGYLAATPLRMQVMRLVQSAMLPESRPAHFAEVFLGGLLRRVDAPDTDTDTDAGAGAVAPAGGGDLGDVEYDFYDGVRDILLSGLRRAEALRVLRNVWDVIRDRLGSPLDFPALLAAVEQGDGEVELERPFAWVAQQVLRRLGGRYSEIARRLQDADAAGGRAPGTATSAGTAAGPTAGAVSGAATVSVPPAGTSAPRTRPPAEPDGGAAAGPGVIWGDVPPRNPNFTGRDAMLRTLREQLADRATALLPEALHGLGGVGKTQVAIEYAHRYMTDYDLVWWVPTEQISLARSSLADLAGRLGVPPSGDVNRTVDGVLEALRAGRPYTRWLLVYDNAGDPDELAPLIPDSSSSGHVLITSRDAAWARHAAVLEVDVLDRSESVALLRRRVPRLSANDAARLAEKLGDLPLAMEQAGAWQAQVGTSVDEYLRLFDRQLDRLRAEDLPADYPLAHAITWGLAFERLCEEAPAAGRLLELCVFFGSEPISLRLLSMGRYADLPPPLDETVTDRNRLERAAGDIQRYALARFDRPHDTIQVHRLVGAALHARLSQDEQAAIRRQVHTVLTAANPDTTPGDETAFPQRAEIAPHVVPSGIIDGEGRKVRQVSLDQIRYLYVLGDYESSRRLGEMVLERWRAKHGPDDEQTLIAGGYLANALRSIGEITEAARLDSDVLDRMRRTLGDDHSRTLDAAISVGADLRLQGEFTRARQLDQDTLQRMRRLRDDEVRTTRAAANSLGIDLRLMGEFQAAFKLDRERYERLRQLLGDGHRDTIFAVHQMARDLHGLGEYQRALELQEESLEQYRALLGRDHTFVLEAAISHAATLRKAGQYARARRTAEENVRLSLRRFGDGHHDTVLARSGLAVDLAMTGDPQRGRLMAERALTNCRRVLGADHPFVHACTVHLGIALRAVGEVSAVSAAREADQTALEALDRLFGASHYYTLCCATGLVNDLYLLGEHQQAYELSADTMDRSSGARGADHPYTLACEHNHALILDALGLADQAHRLREHARTRLRRVLGHTHPEVVSAAAGRLTECDIQPTPP